MLLNPSVNLLQVIFTEEEALTAERTVSENLNK